MRRGFVRSLRVPRSNPPTTKLASEFASVKGAEAPTVAADFKAFTVPGATTSCPLVTTSRPSVSRLKTILRCRPFSESPLTDSNRRPPTDHGS